MTLIEDYKCQILEEINYEKDHDPTHTINETRMDKFKTRGCGCEWNLFRVADFWHQEYLVSLKSSYVILPTLVVKVGYHDPKAAYWVYIYIYIYRLPDSGKAYYLAYRDHLINAGYSIPTSDPCLFANLKENKGMSTYVWIPVHDRIAMSRNTKLKAASATQIKDYISCLHKTALKYSIEEYPPNQPLWAMRTNAFDMNDQGDEPYEPCKYLHLLGMFNCIAHSHPDIYYLLCHMLKIIIAILLGDIL